MSIEKDIAELKTKYGDKKGIPTADQIMRVVKELEKRMEFYQEFDEQSALQEFREAHNRGGESGA